MFVYYKLYREPVSPTISITQCGDQGKTAVPGVEVVQEKTRSVRLTFYFILLERMSSFSAGQSTGASAREAHRSAHSQRSRALNNAGRDERTY